MFRTAKRAVLGCLWYTTICLVVVMIPVGMIYAGIRILLP